MFWEKSRKSWKNISDGVILSKVTVGLLIPLLMKDAIASILLWILKKFSVQPSWQNTSGRLLLWNKCCSVCNCCSLLVYYNWIKISAKSKSFLFKSLSLILLIINNYWQLVITAVFVWKEYVEDFTFKHLLLVEICAREICEKFVYKHSETIEFVKN